MAAPAGESHPNVADPATPALTKEQIKEISAVTGKKTKDTVQSRKDKWTKVYRIIYPMAVEIPAPFSVGTEYARERAENPDTELVSRLAMSCFGNCTDKAKEWLRGVGPFLDILGGRYDNQTGINNGESGPVQHDLVDTSVDIQKHGDYVSGQDGEDSTSLPNCSTSFHLGFDHCTYYH